MIYHCCRELGLEWQTLNYALLGDDIVICNALVAEKYKQFCGALGVSFSLLKTHESKNFFEFAKRMFLKGKEISPFPLSALAQSAKKSYLLTQVLLEVSKKDFPTSQNVWPIVSSYYSTVSNFPKRLRKKFTENSLLAECVMKITSSDPDLRMNASFDAIIWHFGYRLISLPQSVCESILINVTVDEFAKSNDPEKLRTGQPLGLLAQQLVMY